MRRILALIAVCVLAAPTPAQVPDAPIAHLITQLDSEDYTERESATRALERLGSSARPALEAASRSPRPEVARRAAHLLIRLQQHADSVTLLKPRRIRLSYWNVPLAVALADLKARSGLPLDFSCVKQPLRLVSCATGELPVWEALEAFMDAADLHEVFLRELELPRSELHNRTYAFPPHFFHAETAPILLADGPASRLPGSRSSAVRVLALPASFPGHRVYLGSGHVELCLDITPLPGLHWQDSPAVRITCIRDDAGREGRAGITTPSQPQPDLLPSRNGPRVNNIVALRPDLLNGRAMPHLQPNPRIVRLPMQLSTPSARSLTRLEGTIVGTVLLPAQTLITFDAPKRPVNCAFEGQGGLRVMVLNVESIGEQLQLQVRSESPSPWLTRPNRGGLAWPEPPRHEGLGNHWEAHDAAGRMLPLLNCTLLDIHDDGAILSVVQQLSFPRSAGMLKTLRLVGPRRVVVELPFRCEDVPLP